VSCHSTEHKNDIKMQSMTTIMSVFSEEDLDNNSDPPLFIV